MDDVYASLYEHVASGVVRVCDGIVRFANPAATRLTSCATGQRLSHPLLDEMVGAACRGWMTLPLRLHISGPQPIDGSRPDIIDIVITPAPWYAGEVLVTLARRAPQHEHDAPFADLIARVAAELRQPVEELARDLTTGIPEWTSGGSPAFSRPGSIGVDRSAGMTSRTPPGRVHDAGTTYTGTTYTGTTTSHSKIPPDAAALRRSAANAHSLLRKLQKIDDLVSLLGRARYDADERMLLRSLLDAAIRATAPQGMARAVKVRVIHDDAATPAVYGSQRWLQSAIAEVLEHSIGLAAPGGEVEVSVHATGTRASLRARPTLTPALSASPAQAAALARSSLGFSLARQIAWQHGGSLRLEQEFGLLDVVLELPAGAPADEDARLAVEQASRFERSVAELQAHSLSRGAAPAR